jgi:nicotinate-nucleotide adenylyltransferase
VTAFEIRQRLLEAAIAGDPRFLLMTLERGREAPSYTVETLRALREERPGDRFWLLLGEDSLDELHTWREPDEIARLARIAVYRRRGAGGAVPAMLGGRVEMVDGPLVDVSSSWVRARTRAGGSVRNLVPPAVAELIARERLYRDAEG